MSDTPAKPKVNTSFPLWGHIYGAAAVVLLAACWMQLVTIAVNL
jgi:hypothetical protein